MPQAFLVEDPRTGRKLRLEGETAPTKDQLDKIFGTMAQETQPAPASSEKIGDYLVKPESLPENKQTLGGTLREAGTSIGASTAGQILGAPLGPLGVAAGGAIGAGTANLVNQLQRMAEDPEYKFKWGELISEAGTGAIPGGSFLGGGVRGLVKEAAKQGAGAAVGGQIESKFDRGEFLTPKETLLRAAAPAVAGAGAQKLLAAAPEVVSSVSKAMRTRPQAVRVLEEGEKLGLKAVPSDLSPTFAITKGESLGGMVASRRNIQLQNQEKVNDAVRKQLGIKGEISPEALKAVRKKEGEVYDAIETISEQAKPQLDRLKAQRREIELRDDLTSGQRMEMLDNFDNAARQVKGWLETEAAASVTELRRLRGESQKAMDAYYASGGKSVDQQLKAFELREQAKALEDTIEKSVTQMGREDLAKKLVAARQKIAQTYSAENALNLGNYNIDPDKLAQQFRKGVPLSGNMRAIAQFKLAFKNSLEEGSKIPAPGVSTLAPALSTLAGIGTYAGTQSLPATVAAAALPLSRDIARGVMGSDVVQQAAKQGFIERKLAPKVKIPEKVATGEKILRAAGQAVGRGAKPEAPTAEDVQALQENPSEEKEAFEERFGKGSSAKYLFRKSK